MKKIKLHQRLSLLFLSAALALVTGCAKRSFPTDSEKDDRNEAVSSIEAAYAPPTVIQISDDKAKTTKEGELYYDDEYGYRYWRYNDGKYYLDQKYSKGSSPKRKTEEKKKAAKASKPANEGGYTSTR